MNDEHTFGRLAVPVAAQGYSPIPVQPRGKDCLMSGWRTHKFKPSDAKRYPNHSVGLVCGTLSAVDIDVTIAPLAEKLELLAREKLGLEKAPRRVGRAPKVALLARTEEPFAKIRTGCYLFPGDSPEAKPHAVEMLGRGQQIVAYGIHSVTGKPYTWNGDGEPLTVALADLPVITEQAAREFIAEADAVLRAAGGKPAGKLHEQESQRPHEANEKLLAEDPDKCEAALAAIPNEDLAYDDWIIIIYAAKGALGERGMAAAEAFSRKSAKHDQRTFEKAWSGARPERVGAGSIFYHARLAGWGVDQRPVITVKAGEINALVLEIAAALAAARLPYYRRNHVLVRTERLDEEQTDSACVSRPAGAVALRPASLPRLRGDVSNAAALVRWSGAAKDYVACDLPENVGNTLIASAPDLRCFPIVEGLSAVPIMRENGFLLTVPGYDPEHRIIFDARGVDFSGLAVPERPTKKQAATALKVLLHPLQDFAFVDDASRSAVLAAMLTTVVRAAIDCAPVFGYRAPSWGCGKTLLAQLVARIGTGNDTAVVTIGNEDEFDKAIDSTLLSGDPVVLIDNISGALGGDKLCAALTAKETGIRLFHTQVKQTVPNRSLWQITGMNLRLRGDMVRRSLIAAIDPDDEHPERRKGFKIPDLLKWALANRIGLLSAAYTILRAHIMAEPASLGSAFGSFEDWSRRVREPLLWLDQADPLQRQDAMSEDDPVKEQTAQVFAALHKEFGDTPWTVHDLFERYRNPYNDPPPAAALAEFYKNRIIDAKGLGYWLRSRDKMIANGLKLAKDGVTDGAVRWKFFKHEG